MIANSFLVLATAALAATSPTDSRRRLHRFCSGPQPILPVNGDSQELPSPPPGARLKRIALGYGIQNYTCDGTDADPVTTGALAGLFDMTPFYPNPEDPKSLDQATFDRLTAMVIESVSQNIPLKLEESLPNRVPTSAPGADLSSPYLPAAPLPIPGVGGLQLQHTGQHFFTDAGVPMFKLDDGLSIQGAKLDSSNAPKSSATGPNGEAAVAWLRLGVKEGTEGKGTNGLTYVYRVQTAAGASHGCKEGGENDSSFYTAAYWLYG